jgi:hypothetical protein
MDSNPRKIFDFLTKGEIHMRVEAMQRDDFSVMPLYLFCELANMHKRDYQKVFLYHQREMSNLEQKRLSRALILMENGEVKAIYNYGLKKAELEFQKAPKPRLGRRVLMNYNQATGFTIKPSIYNKQAYNLPRLLDKNRGKA